MTTMDRRLQKSGEEIRNRAVYEVVQKQHSDIISPPCSINSAIINAQRRRAFDSDDVDRKLLDGK